MEENEKNTEQETEQEDSGTATEEEYAEYLKQEKHTNGIIGAIGDLISGIIHFFT